MLISHRYVYNKNGQSLLPKITAKTDFAYKEELGMKKRTKLLALTLIFAAAVICALASCNNTAFTVTVVNGTGGGTYEKGNNCTVTATIGQDEEFCEWQIDGKAVSTENPYTFNVTQDVTIKAVTKAKTPTPPEPEKFTVTIVGGTGSGTYEKGSVCTAAATLEKDEVFVSWVDENRNVVSTENPYKFEVNSDISLTAVIKHYVDLGAYALNFVSVNGNLDLVERKYNGKDCEILSLEGEGANAVIECKVDNDTYTLSLSGEGALEMRSADNVLTDTFLPSANAYAGLWTNDNNNEYTLIINELDRNNRFGWTLLDENGAYSQDTLYEAVTKLVFDSNNNATVQFAVDAVSRVYTVNAQSSIEETSKNITYTPTDALFRAVYVNDGKILTVNRAETKINVDGSETQYKTAVGKFGAGLYFTSNDKQYALIQMLDCIALLTDGSSEYFAEFDASNFDGIWQSGQNTLTVDGNSIVFNQTETQAQPILTDGELFVGFTADKTYTIFPVAESDVILRLTDGETSEYYFKSTVDLSAKFAGEYTDNANTLTVSDGFNLTLNDTNYTAALTVLEDLDRVNLQGIQSAALSFDNNSKFIVYAGEGRLIVLEKNSRDDYVVKYGFFKPDVLNELQTQFNTGLNSVSDVYTVGGVNGFDVAYDFANNKVIHNGAPTDFVWSYEIKSTGDEYAVISYTADVNGAQCNCRLYPYFDEPYIRVDAYTLSGKKTIYTLVSRGEFEKLFGTSYVKIDETSEQSISFDADGTLVITKKVILTGESAENRYENYTLTREKGTNVLIVTFKDPKGIMFEVSIYCDVIGYSISMVTDTFLTPDAVNFVGQYAENENKIAFEILDSGKIKYNPEGIGANDAATVIDGFKSENGKITLTFTVERGNSAVNVTAVLENNTATVTENEGQPTVYTKRQSSEQPPAQDEYDENTTPEAFVGTFNLADENDTTWLLNIAVQAGEETGKTRLAITLDGKNATNVKLKITDGKQQLSFDIRRGLSEETITSFVMTLEQDGTFSISDTTGMVYTIIK